MKYFIREEERRASESTCYHEFYKGAWDREALVFWSNDSLNIHDVLMISLGLDRLIFSVVENYDPYGETEIDANQWRQICAEAQKTGGNLLEAIRELIPWAEDNFKRNKVFTILGI